MADWFKFYENDIDDSRLQYAIDKLPEVLSIWIGLLAECCKHKSQTIPWSHNEVQLFGFSRRLNVNLGKVNLAINLLIEIGFIKRDVDTITVQDWNKKQSEYCQWSQKNTNKRKPKKVSGHSRDGVRLEERRVEEIRKGEEGVSPILKANGAQTVEWGKEHARIIERIRLLGASYSEHQSWSSGDLEKKRDLISRRDELRDLLLLKY